MRDDFIKFLRFAFLISAFFQTEPKHLLYFLESLLRPDFVHVGISDDAVLLKFSLEDRREGRSFCVRVVRQNRFLYFGHVRSLSRIYGDGFHRPEKLLHFTCIGYEPFFLRQIHHIQHHDDGQAHVVDL